MEELRKAVEDLFARKYIIGHDFKHAQKVAHFAKLIAKDEGYDEDEAQITGYLHDIGRTLQDTHVGHAQASVPLAREFLDKYTNYPTQTKERILYAIEHHSDKTTDTKLANILQDGDKLDGMGAIGVIRACVSRYYLPDYDNNALSLTQASQDPKTIYEFILFQIRWMDMLYSKTARKIAKKRYEFMILFLKQLREEIEETK